MPATASRPTPKPGAVPRAERARRTATVAEIAAARGLSVNTVLWHRGQHDDWPAPVGTRRAGRGRPQLEYDQAAIDDFYRGKDATVDARRGAQAGSTWPDSDLVAATVAAARLKIPYNTFRTYPALYPPGSACPFPSRVTITTGRWSLNGMIDAETAAARLKVPVDAFLDYPRLYPPGRRNSFPCEYEGHWRWGDLVAWAAHCYRWKAVLAWAKSRPGSGHPHPAARDLA